MLDADAIYSAISVNSFVATITTTCYGGPVEGLVDFDFNLFDVATGLQVSIASTDETDPGVYLISLPAPATIGDVLKLKAYKDRFDFSAMSDGTNNIVIV